jgi:very-short-patch-repair endonuclease
MSLSGYADNLLFQCRAARLPMPIPEYRFHPTRKWRLDLAWPDRWLYVEVDGGTWVGGRHNRGKGYEADCEKLNAACLQGWRGLRFTTAMVKDGRALTALETALGPLRAVGATR